MLEESKMDKKSLNRSSQPQPRATAVDCKKNTELTQKIWPRNNKKREGPGSASKNEPYRKSGSAQRGRGAVDRRPRSRDPSSLSLGGIANTRIEDEEQPEIGSVFVPGSKKQNLNHLLNFTYPTRRVPQQRGPLVKRNTQQHQESRDYKRNIYKQHCQFVVKEDGDYKANLMDPDAQIKWEQVEEIVVRSAGSLTCPICLGFPVAGRVDVCGHMHCWACALHLGAASEKQPPLCPVCNAPLNVKDMRPARFLQWDAPGEEVTMRLVRRLRGSTVVEAAPLQGQITTIEADSILPLENISNAPYCRIFSIKKQQVHDIIHRERDEIKKQILEEIDTTEIDYLEQALDMLKFKQDNINIIDSDKPIVVEEEDAPVVYEKLEMNQNKMDWFDVNEEGAACVELLHDKINELDINVGVVDSNLNPEAPLFEFEPEKMPKNENFPEPDEVIDNATTNIDKLNQAKYFYFYQSDDGQPVFLDNLNVRILKESWGSLAASPQIIRGRVLTRESYAVDEQIRKHMPCATHLAHKSPFDIVDLDLHPPYVTNAALQCFTEALRSRARQRARHKQEERRRERAYRRTLEGPPKPDVFSEVLFPSTPTYSSPPLEPGPSTANDLFTSPTSVGSPPSGPSFAKMASTSGTWRVRSKVPEQPPPPHSAEDDESSSSAPRALILSDAIEAALQAAPSPSGKKNKKNKQKLLFTTGIQHNT